MSLNLEDYMAIKNDFTKTMRNIAASDNNETGRYHKGPARDDRIHSEITIAPSDKSRLERFARQETAYYNGLVEAFSPRTRAFPDTLTGLTDDEEKLYATIAMLNSPVMNILRDNEVDAIPEGLQPFKALLFGKPNKPSKMSYDKAAVVDMGAIAASILPEVRRNMAVEFLEHYQRQARKIATPSTNAEQAFKEPPEFLVELTTQQKRHLQIPRKSLNMKWDDENKQTLILCRYVANPMVVNDINLLEMSGWNYMVLHQEHVKKVTPMTPWVIDVRRTNAKYLLKMVDSAGSWRSKIFNEAKKRSF